MLALVMVIGGHWALLQSVAWVGMTVKFAQTDTFATALQKTFDGQHPCSLCQLVKAGKASEKKQELQKLETKLDFQLLAGTVELYPPRPSRHFTPQTERADAGLFAPPVPPPRAA